MSDNFKQREASEEAKYKNREEMQFKIDAKSNRLLGLWAAEKLGLSGDQIDAFAKKVVVSDLEEAGKEDVVRMVSQSFRNGGVNISDDEIRQKINECQAEAIKLVDGTYPDPLGDDHVRIGD